MLMLGCKRLLAALSGLAIRINTFILSEKLLTAYFDL